jgi:hypothetical protein
VEKIIRGIGSGKTLDLIKISSETGNVIVCFNDEKQIKAKASTFGYDIPNPISYSNFIQKNYDKEINGFLIDDVEIFLQQLTDIPINGFVATQTIRNKTHFKDTVKTHIGNMNKKIKSTSKTLPHKLDII